MSTSDPPKAPASGDPPIRPRTPPPADHTPAATTVVKTPAAAEVAAAAAHVEFQGKAASSSSPARRSAVGARNAKRRKLPAGEAEHGVLSATEREENQDEIITDLRAALARADDAATADRTDRKAILGALDVLASSVREVKAAVQTPANRSTANGVPSAASFEFQPKRPTLAEIAARDPPAVSPPQAPAPGFGRPTPATEALARAIQPPRPSPAALLRNAVRAPPRSLLGPQDFALIHIRNLRRMAPSAVRSMCAALGVDVAHIHDVGRVGPVTELVVTKNRRDEIASQLSVSPVADAPELALQLDLAFDASKPVLPNANAELAERVRADFNARMREQQGRCAGFGWTGLADFFAGRVSTAASRRAGQTTTPAKNDDQTAQARNTATHAAALPSSASADASSAMEGVEGDAAGTVLPAAAATASAPSLPKFLAARQWLSHGIDLVGVLESWYLHRHLYASDPSFLVATEPQPPSPALASLSSSPSSSSLSQPPPASGRQHDGILILASARLRNSVINITRSPFFVRIVLPGLTIAFVYAPPRLNDSDFLQIFRDLEDCDVILGDLNVRLDPLLGASGAARPFGRYHTLALWMACAGFSALPPSSASTASSRWDHVLVRSELWADLDSCLTISSSASVGIPSDHPALDLRFPLVNPASSPPEPDAGLRRMHLGRLHRPGAWARLQEAYAAVSPDVDVRLDLAETAVASALDQRTRQEVVDAADAVLHEAVLAAGFCCLGQYDVAVARARPDWTRSRLSQSTTTLDAERLWRKPMRGQNRPMIASAAASARGLGAQEEAMEFWGAAWGSSDPPLQPPPDAFLPPGPVDVTSDALASQFSVAAVERVIRRYPRHKSGGEDGDHGLLLAALSGAQPSRTHASAPPSVSLSASLSQSPALPTPGATRASARLRERRPTLNPRAAPFVPLSARPPAAAPPTPQLRFPVQLARLFRLVAACRVIPRRWGRALVHLIPKSKDGLPSPSSSRPIAMLPMFRRLFESIFVRQLSGDSGWTRLHPAQAGFRRGWSCQSALLLNHVASSSRPVAVYLDMENAFPSVLADQMLASLDRRGAPLWARQMSWALLVSGASAALVVNKFRSPALPLRRGLPQGAVCSPAFFSLFIDELLHALNDDAPADDPNAVFYADDGAIMAHSVEEAQALLARAEAWATHRGLRFNVRKCGVVAPFPVAVTLYDQQLPQVSAYKYLGIMRAPSGLDLAVYLDAKLEAMAAVLRRLRAVGAGWTSLARLAVFRSHCSSILDYGGGLVHHFAQLPDSPITPAQLSRLDDFFASAACWICDLPLNRRSLAHSMSGLLPGCVRLEHLALGLELHLLGAHRCNPARALLRSSPPPHATLHGTLLASLRNSPLAAAFAVAGRQHRAAHPSWAPLSPRAFLRRTRRQWLSTQTGTLGARLGPQHRLRSLADRVLGIRCPRLRLLAVRWRARLAFCGMACFCGARFTASHTDCLLHTIGFLPLTHIDQASAARTFRAWAHEREAMATMHLIDFLLGHHQAHWFLAALEVLFSWSFHLASHHGVLPPIPVFPSLPRLF